MFRIQQVWPGIVLALVTAGSATAQTADEPAGKALAERYLTALGTPQFDAIAAELESADHRRLRHEFENLKYNADDPILSSGMDSETEAITARSNTIVQLIADGDLVAARLRIRGTHSGNLFGIPATGKSFDIASGAVLRLRAGKIVESWFMAEEARLLRQLDAPLPGRQDGKINLPPAYDDTGSYDTALASLIAAPVNSPAYRRKRLMLAYKARTKPADYTFTGRPYSKLLRGGIANIVERAAELDLDGSHGASMSGREDRLGYIATDGDQGMMTFRLTAENSGPLYGIPPSGEPLNFWELSFAKFDGDTWSEAWWMADELGFLLTIGSDEALDFLVSD